MSLVDLLMGFWAGMGFAAALSSGSPIRILCWGALIVLQWLVIYKESRPMYLSPELKKQLWEVYVKQKGSSPGKPQQ